MWSLSGCLQGREGLKKDKMGIECEPAVMSPTNCCRDDVFFQADPEVRIALVYDTYTISAEK